MKHLLLLLFIVGMVAAGCSSGKKAYEKGNYDKAVLQSVKRLRQKPDHRKSVNVLKESYPLAKQQHLENVNRWKVSNDQLRWEHVVQEYQMLNHLYTEIKHCPSCIKYINPEDFTAELNEAKVKAAEVRFRLGEEMMKSPRKDDARLAYEHFRVADIMVPGFRDVRQKMEQSLEAAIYHVVLQFEPLNYSVLQPHRQYLEDKIYEYMMYQRLSEFVRIYTPASFQMEGPLDQPDQVIHLRFDDFVLGNVYAKEKVEQLSKDSVVVGTTEVEGQKQNVYGTVKAEMHTFTKSLTSTATLDVNIIERGATPVMRYRFPGNTVWVSEWGYFSGDERALTEGHKQLTKKKELPPPPPDVLFYDLARPLLDQAVDRITRYYVNF